MKDHIVSNEVEDVIKSIIIATGSVSVSVNPDYNSALAHALYYGLTVREWMERKHLHGEIVSYGTLVQLLLDKQYDELRRVYDFNKKVKLPVCLRILILKKMIRLMMYWMRRSSIRNSIISHILSVNRW